MAAWLIAASLPTAAVLIGAGVLVAIAGHLAGSRRTVAGGLALLFVASGLLLGGAYGAYRDGEPDPRPCEYAPEAC